MKKKNKDKLEPETIVKFNKLDKIKYEEACRKYQSSNTKNIVFDIGLFGSMIIMLGARVCVINEIPGTSNFDVIYFGTLALVCLVSSIYFSNRANKSLEKETTSLNEKYGED